MDVYRVRFRPMKQTLVMGLATDTPVAEAHDQHVMMKLVVCGKVPWRGSHPRTAAVGAGAEALHAD